VGAHPAPGPPAGIFRGWRDQDGAAPSGPHLSTGEPAPALRNGTNRIDLANTTDAHEEKKMDMKSKLSTLWIFVSLNYLYCDVSSLMDPELLPQYLRGNVHGLQFSPMFLLSAGVLVEIFIAMVLLSKVLPYRANRWANVAAGIVMTAIQLATLFFGVPAPYYAFFSAIEIATTAFIVWYAWNWAEAAVAPSMTPPAPAK
jgi:hypothetical protein